MYESKFVNLLFQSDGTLKLFGYWHNWTNDIHYIWIKNSSNRLHMGILSKISTCLCASIKNCKNFLQTKLMFC